MPIYICLEIRLSREQKARLRERARAYNLPLATMARRMLLNERIPDPSHHQAIQTLCKLHASCVDQMDLVRRHFLSSGRTEPDAESLLGEIRDITRAIRGVVVELGTGRQPRPYRLAPAKMDRLVGTEPPDREAGHRPPREPEP